MGETAAAAATGAATAAATGAVTAAATGAATAATGAATAAATGAATAAATGAAGGGGIGWEPWEPPWSSSSAPVLAVVRLPTRPGCLATNSVNNPVGSVLSHSLPIGRVGWNWSSS